MQFTHSVVEVKGADEMFISAGSYTKLLKQKIKVGIGVGTKNEELDIPFDVARIFV